MRVMGIEALVPRPGTSKAAPGHKIYPYLLRGLKIVEPNHVWAADVTYIPMACGFLYLVAIIDWASRAVLAWRLSNTNDASFCAAALGEALLRFGKPRIFNTDQGSTFTAEAFTSKLVTAGVVISMDGRGRFMDNIFIERLWRSIKYEEVHLKAYADGCEARSGISSWMNFYNFRRPHQAMNNQMPMAVWRAGMDKIEAAARAVDMPLRLDNANALPTYPQQKQQQAASFLKDNGRRDYTLNSTTLGPTNGVQFTACEQRTQARIRAVEEQLDKLVAVMGRVEGATVPTSSTFDDYDVQFLAESLAEDRSWLPHGSHVETTCVDTSTPLSRPYGPTFTETATSISIPIIGTFTPRELLETGLVTKGGKFQHHMFERLLSEVDGVVKGRLIGPREAMLDKQRAAQKAHPGLWHA